MNIDIVSSIVIILFSIAFGVSSTKFNTSSNYDIGAQFMPLVYVILLVSLSILNILFSIREKNKEENQEIYFNKNTFIVMAIFICYIIIINIIGFYIATPIFIFGLLIFLKEKNIKQILLISIIMTVGIYLIFGKLLNVLLPQGILFR